MWLGWIQWTSVPSTRQCGELVPSRISGPVILFDDIHQLDVANSKCLGQLKKHNHSGIAFALFETT